MIKFFSFLKSNKPSFEVKEENLKKMGISDIAKESICNVDNRQTGYENPKWVEKSNSIKDRDNYTCQLCNAFDASHGHGLFIEQGTYLTIHHYDRDHSIYNIIIPSYDFNITFEFKNNYKLVMPSLNVHHKLSFRNRDLWDYPDECLVTLCENCHHYLHSLEDIIIPIVEERSNGSSVIIAKKQPNPYNPQLDHTAIKSFLPFSIVKENRFGDGLKGLDLIEFQRAQYAKKKWYDYQDILDNSVVQISYLICEDPCVCKHSKDELKDVADFIIQDFIENILGFKKQ